MRKIGWGTKIAILYIGFVVLVISMVVVSMNQKIDLVSEDYYPKELVFQNQINSTNNANALLDTIANTITLKGIDIQFPSVFIGRSVSGTIEFFRPSDSSKDFSTAIKLDETAHQFISSKELISGKYKMQISWKADNKDYYSDHIVIIKK